MAVIYRYTDLYDGIIKYVGIVWSDNRTLFDRVKEHRSDEWYNEGRWKIEYLQKSVNTRTDAEILERHYISKFHTNEWFNKAKSSWGECTLMNSEDEDWSLFWQDKDPKSDFTYSFSESDFSSYTEGILLYNKKENSSEMSLKFNNLLHVTLQDTCISFIVSGYHMFNAIKSYVESYPFKHVIKAEVSEIDGSLQFLDITGIGFKVDADSKISDSITHYELNNIEIKYTDLIPLSKYLKSSFAFSVGSDSAPINGYVRWEDSAEKFADIVYERILKNIVEVYGYDKFLGLVDKIIA